MASLKELRHDAKALGIKGYTKLSEGELERAIAEAQSSFMKRFLRGQELLQRKAETSVDAKAVAVEPEGRYAD